MLSNSVSDKDNASKFLVGTGKEQVHLCVVITADRGLCGGYNANIIKRTEKRYAELTSQGFSPDLVLIGKKAIGYFQQNRSTTATAGSYKHQQDLVYGRVPLACHLLGSQRGVVGTSEGDLLHPPDRTKDYYDPVGAGESIFVVHHASAPPPPPPPPPPSLL